MIDAAVAPDAATAVDAVATLDVRTGDVPFVCDVQADRVIVYSDATPSLPLDVFQALCNRVGGTIEIHMPKAKPDQPETYLCTSVKLDANR